MVNKCIVNIASHRNSCIFCYWILPFGLNQNGEVAVRLMSRNKLWLLALGPRRSPQHYKSLSSIWWSCKSLPRTWAYHLLDFCRSLLFLSFQLILNLLFSTFNSLLLLLFSKFYARCVKLEIPYWKFSKKSRKEK